MGWFSRSKEPDSNGADAGPPAEADDRIGADKVHVLLDTIAELISTVDHDAVLASIVDKAIASVGAERGILFLFDGDDRSRPRIKVARDGAGRDLPAPIQYSTTVIRRVASDGQPLCFKVSAHEDVADLSRSIVDMKLRAVMCVTLRVKERPLGIIYVDSRANRREFTAADLRFFDALAGALAIAVENARLVGQVLAADRMKQQIRIARRIQEGLLPKDPTMLPGFDVAGRAIPAEEALGDYYDFFPLHDGRWVVAIGDVAGHGLGPALLMSSARALLRSAAHGSFDLADALATINDRLEADSAGAVFMSLFAAVLDVGTRTFHYANAGHTPPLLLRATAAGPRDAVALAATGIALGVEDGARCDVAGPVALGRGDLLLLCTDGILEARRGEAFFGRERLEDAAFRARDARSREVIETLHREALAFSGGQPLGDDVTLVVVRAT